MAGKLNNLTVARLGSGSHADGGGLYLRVSGGSRTWSFRYQRQGKAHWLSLGRTDDFTLAEVRQKARECRRQLFNGVDIAVERKKARALPPVGVTFGQVAADYIAAFEGGWGPKQATLWRSALARHAGSLLDLPISEVGVHEVMAVLDPIWRTKNETASKLRGRIESILTYARAKELRTGDNPAEWRGRLKALLPNRSEVASVVHRPALPWLEMPVVMARLAQSNGVSAKCLAFTILTAVRPAEAREAQWAEIDFDAAVWTVPSSRMKSKRPHRVPLTSALLAILAFQQTNRREGASLVFEGGKHGCPLSDVAVTKALHVAAGRVAVTVRGCRSSFRDWCDESANASSELAEAALAHVNPDKTERAYARSDFFDQRRGLMQAWTAFCLRAEYVTSLAPYSGDDHRVVQAEL